MKYYLKEEFLHDVNAKNAGNKARNDVESIVKEEGYHPLVLSQYFLRHCVLYFLRSLH